MRRMCLLLTTLLSTLVQLLGAVDSRPNIVVILVDDLRHDALSCTGHPWSKTPGIDRIAAEGLRLRNAFCNDPVCSPSRASLLSGQCAHRHRMLVNETSTPEDMNLVTFPALLQESGYRTGYVGKWHMNSSDDPRPGFDRWVSFNKQGDYNKNNFDVDGVQVSRTGYVTDVLTDFAEQFISQTQGGDKPFCLYLSHKAVHGPFTPATRHENLYTNASIPATPNRTGPRVSQTVINQMRCLAAIDESTSRVLAALEAVGKLDNTLIVFTSDHGYLWGEHGKGDKRWPYEESIRIPWLMRLPGRIGAGRISDALAQTIDLAPTCLELAGVPIPAWMQGRSLLPLFGGGTPSHWRDSLLIEYQQDPKYPEVGTYSGVRTTRWKYASFTDPAQTDMLFDLNADPYEINNLWNDAAYTAVKNDLEQQRKGLTGVNRAPSIAITAPAPGATMVVNQPIIIRVAVNDADGPGTIKLVEFRVNGSAIQTDVQAPWQATWTPSLPGVYSITAHVKDLLNASAISTAVSVTVTAANTNLPPNITLTQPVADSNVTEGVALALAADASDDVGVVRVDFLVDGVVVATDTSAVGGWTSTWPAAGTGTRSISARATDGQGALTTSLARNIVIAPPDNGGPGPDLLASWPFDGSGQDASGHDKHLAISGGPLFSDLAIAGQSLLCVGKGVADAPIIDFGQASTITAWIRINDVGLGNRCLLANCASGGERLGFKINVHTWQTADRRVIVQTGNGTTQNSASTTAGAIGYDTWHHLAVTIDRVAGEARIRIDGQDVTSDASILKDFGVRQTVQVGRMRDGASALSGRIDNLMLHRGLLSADRIAELATPPGGSG